MTKGKFRFGTHYLDEFAVGVPPVVPPSERKPNGGTQRAFDFCLSDSNRGKWCSVFTYFYSDNIPESKARTRAHGRLQIMRDFAYRSGTTWDCFAYQDKHIKAFIVWGRINEQEEESHDH